MNAKMGERSEESTREWTSQKWGEKTANRAHGATVNNNEDNAGLHPRLWSGSLIY